VTLDQLRYFLAAARHEHVGRAAEASHISSSVISLSIKTIEEELKTELFKRVGRRIILTEKGQQLRDEVERILKDVSSLGSKLNHLSLELTGHYRISSSHSLSARFLSPAIAEIQKIHPRLSFDLTAASTQSIVSDILSGRLEAGLCFLPVKHPELEEQILYVGDHEVVVRPNHPLLKEKTKKPFMDLELYPATFHKVSPSHDLLTYSSFMKQYGITQPPMSTYDNADLGIPLVLNSNAWTIIPDILAKIYGKQLGVLKRPKDWRMPLRISLIYRKDNKSNLVLKELSETLSKSFRVFNSK
jgi:DNA-binding transcriptional LysR family regulator